MPEMDAAALSDPSPPDTIDSKGSGFQVATLHASTHQTHELWQRSWTVLESIQPPCGSRRGRCKGTPHLLQIPEVPHSHASIGVSRDKRCPPTSKVAGNTVRGRSSSRKLWNQHSLQYGHVRGNTTENIALSIVFLLTSVILTNIPIHALIN